MGFKYSPIAWYTIRGGLEKVVIGYFWFNLLSVVNINEKSSSSLLHNKHEPLFKMSILTSLLLSAASFQLFFFFLSLF